MTEVLGTAIVLLALAALITAMLADVFVGIFPWGWRRERRVGFNTQEEVRCSECGVTNRVPESRSGEPARCGKCKAPLRNGLVQRLSAVRGVMQLRSMQPRTVLIILLGLFAWFVWPTPYRDLPCSTGAASYWGCYHINRITGAICPLSQTCWINPRMW